MVERKGNIPDLPFPYRSDEMTDIEAINYEELDYTDDRRVQLQDDGTILVTFGVLYDTDRVVSYYNQIDGVDYFIARGRTSTDCDVYDDSDGYNRRLRLFASAEAAVCHIIGAPSDLQFDGREYRMFLLMNEDGTPKEFVKEDYMVNLYGKERKFILHGH